VLYAAEAHEPLTGTIWSESRVRDSIAAIVRDADAAFDPDAFWPVHEWDAWRAALPLKNLYAGAAGVALGLDALRRRGHAESALDLAAVARRALEAFVREPDYIADGVMPAQRRSSLFFGEAGILLVAHRLAPSPELEHTLLTLVEENLGNDANELMWGVAGTLLVARELGSAAAEAASVAALQASRDPDGFWTQHIDARPARYIGPAHGLVGNVAALGEPGTAGALLAETALVEDGRANWPRSRGQRPTSASSGATARPASSRTRRRSSTPSSCSRAQSSSGRPARSATRRGRGSATAWPATATRS
jgi:lanthionine synthetase-like protein